MKKKLLTLVLALTMVLSMSMTAMAEGTDPVAASPAGNFTFKKAYTVTGSDTLFPAETLKFTSVADEANPTTTNIVIDDVEVDAKAKEITVTIPSLSELGQYTFTITENEGTTQGVTYSDDEADAGKVLVKVLVAREMDNNGVYCDANGDGYLYTATVAPVGEGTTKNDTFTNEYKLGDLSVTKKVTGNAGDTAMEFPVKVTFTTEEGKTVESKVSYIEDGTKKEVTFNNKNNAEVIINLKHGETITFEDIPVGVNYVVEETDAKEHAATYENQNGTITVETTTATITNTKNAQVDTGIIVNNLPYILVLAGVAVAAVVLFRRKRYSAM